MMNRPLTRLRGSMVARALLLAAFGLSSLPGCSRQFWHRQAERDTYKAELEKLNNPHWRLPRIDMRPDARSRFFDPFDPDCEPLPPDDPAAHQYMHCVDGWRGYKSWHKLGTALSIENPQWLEQFDVRVQGADPVIGHPLVKIENATLKDSVELSYIHSRDYQTAIEDLYLAALALTFERFRFGVRYLGVSGGEPGATVTSTTVPSGGDDSVRLDGRIGVSQLLPSGAQWAIELANNTLWVFGSGGTSSGSTLAYSLVQPLLFGAGRKIVLEDLTQAERNVLYEARDLARFRLVLFTTTASDYLNLLLQRQTIRNAESNILRLEYQIEATSVLDDRRPQQIKEFLDELPADAMVPESIMDKVSYDPIGKLLVWRGTTITESEVADLLSISADERFQFVANELIQRLQTENFSLRLAELITSLNSSQNQLANNRRQYGDLRDNYKISLGLPPNIDLDIDTSLLDPFQLIDPGLQVAEASLRDVLQNFEVLGDAPTAEDARAFSIAIQQSKDQLYESGLSVVRRDLTPLQQLLDATADDWKASPRGQRRFLNEAERDRVVRDTARDIRLYRSNEAEFGLIAQFIDELTELLSDGTAESLVQRLDANSDGEVTMNELPAVVLEDPPTRKQALEVSVPRQQKPAPDENQPDEQTSESERLEDYAVPNDQLAGLLVKALRVLRENLLQVAQSLQVVQAGLRVDVIALNPFVLNGGNESPGIDEVVRIGLENRRDLMNARAAVMDSRRNVEIVANRLEASLDVVMEADVRNPGGNAPFDFRGRNSSYRAGLRFTAPVDQVAERNAYNAALIEYQRQRRAYMALEDQVKQQIRQRWRQLEVSEQQIEIDRQTIRNAAIQYDSASLDATRPVQGQQTSSFSILNALNTLLNAQNALIRDWVTYEQNRLQIFRDMGIMDVDAQGLWADPFYQSGSMTPPAPVQNSDVPPEMNDDSVDDVVPPIPAPTLESTNE